MRQVVITKAGPPEVLKVLKSPDPEAGRGQVRVRVRAAGINFADLVARMGMYPDAPPIPCVVGYETAGVIDQVGADVVGFSVADRVIACPHFGGHSDVVVVPVGQAYRMPEKMSFEEGAALPVAYLTAHHMLLYIQKLRRGSSLLIHSVAGGVGLAALDIAKAHDCVVFGTCSPSKFEFVKQRGCQNPVDSRGDWESAVREVVGDKGIDVILDPIGGGEWRKEYRLLAKAGHLVCFGFSSAQASGKSRNLFRGFVEILRMKWFNPIGLMMGNKTVSGVNMGHMFDNLEVVRPQFEALIAMFERGEIAPFVDRTFKFAEAPAAHHYIHDRKARGRVGERNCISAASSSTRPPNDLAASARPPSALCSPTVICVTSDDARRRAPPSQRRGALAG